MFVRGAPRWLSRYGDRAQSPTSPEPVVKIAAACGVRPGTLAVLLATWRSGYAAACKAVYTSSILVGAFQLHPRDMPV